MRYKITKQYLRGPEIAFAEFEEINDAKQFIQLKLSEDVALKQAVTYRVLQSGVVIEEFEPGSSTGSGAATSSAGQGKQGASTSFQPTPFSAVPRPAGMPAQWLKVDTKKDDDKK